jgi:hypothetical protein
LSTATLTRRHTHHRATAKQRSVLGALGPEARTRFKRTYRRSCAIEAGANPVQLAALALLEPGYDKHYPEYANGHDGTIIATYSHPDTGTTTAEIYADGTIRIRQ